MKVEYFNPNINVKKAPLQTNGKIHIVCPAETYRSLSEKYGIKLNELVEKNNSETLFIGKIVNIK